MRQILRQMHKLCFLLESAGRLMLIDTGIGIVDTPMPVERIGQQLIDNTGFKFNEQWTAKTD